MRDTVGLILVIIALLFCWTNARDEAMQFKQELNTCKEQINDTE